MFHPRCILVTLSLCSGMIVVSMLTHPTLFAVQDHRDPPTSTGVDQLAGLHTNASSRPGDIEAIGKWQQVQVQEFCKKYGNITSEKNMLNDRHILFDVQRKFILCVIPKVGCTYAKEFMFILAGIIPEFSVAKEMKTIPHQAFLKGFARSSFRNKSLSVSEKHNILNTYWKFTIIRNPLERLVSAFRDKLISPLEKTQTAFNFNGLKIRIMERYHPDKLSAWKSNNLLNVSLDFESVVRWVVDTPNEQLDQHFKSQIYITHPCRVKYEYFGNFKHISSDMHRVMDKFNIPRNLYRAQGYYRSGQNTSALLMSYYSPLSSELKEALFEDLYMELDLYYRLFPEERNSHVKLLGTARKF